ncbi:YwdI family protein [Bacillus sp. NPDC077027]|uniref:YwdI family protein n=1 Tax=Bacillus sp. NPDC077027 TaxID=3390548 RepID=UPI003CFE2A2C
MNIHISSLLQKMDEAIRKAKQAGNEEEVKRQVAAISSLCDVILDEPVQVKTPTSPMISTPPSVVIPSPQVQTTDQLMLEKLMGTTGAKQFQNKGDTQKEEEGNGDSIFDF